MVKGFFANNKNMAGHIIAFILESNAGGIAPNADATVGELSPRSAVQILNNTSLVFETLDIGTNNLIDHAGLTDNTTHSWELQLANILTAAGRWEYLVKGAQGGSVISEWDTGDPYYITLKDRLDTAIALTGISNIVFWYSHGVNDRIAGTSTGTFKTATENLIGNLKTDFPGAKFILLKNMTNNGNDVYNTVLQEIADADADVDIVDSSTSVQGDGNHWTYTGQKENADNFYTAMVANGW